VDRDAAGRLTEVEGLVVGAAELDEVDWVGVRNSKERKLPELGSIAANGRVARFGWIPPDAIDDVRSVYLRVVLKDQNRGWASPI
jgi:hypothetical protein